MSVEDQLLAISPLDGRYADKTAELSPIVSEYGLINYRVAVEIGWLSTVASMDIHDMPPLEDNERDRLTAIKEGFDMADAVRIKDIESTTRHDVKAVEVWLRELLGSDDSFKPYLELIHIGCTSEDINNLAYALMLDDLKDEVLLPQIDTIRDDLGHKANEYKDMPLLARTHGQPASPTTIGKEMAVFEERLWDSASRIGSVVMRGKFNGASGNYNAMQFAYPDTNWREVSKRFVESFGLEFNETTTQIEPHDWMAAFFNETALNNTTLIDLSRDMWSYISNGIFRQKAVATEVGSSTMPHKVNPIDFENAEGNFGVANALLDHLANKLPVSRLQRDLSDSTALRVIGEAYGHTLIAHKSLRRGLGKVQPDADLAFNELDREWSVLTEAVQTSMRRYGVPNAYDVIKEASRGKEFTKEDYLGLVANLDIPEPERERLLALTPATYLGRASEIAADE